MCSLRTFQSSESLTSLSIFVPNRGCNGTFCLESEEYPDTGRILDILDSEGESANSSNKFEVVNAGNRDLLKMLYHHHEEIISEDTEVELEAEVISRGSWNTWNTPFPLPPHQEEPLCTEITEYVFPKAALSKQKQWRY